jgi:hypothetical protein
MIAPLSLRAAHQSHFGDRSTSCVADRLLIWINAAMPRRSFILKLSDERGLEGVALAIRPFHRAQTFSGEPLT